MQMYIFLTFAAFISACYGASDVGKACQSESECDSFGQYCAMFSGCMKGSCTCGTGYKVHSSNLRQCEIVVTVGAACDANNVCPPGSSCKDKKCVCKTNMKPDEDHGKCIENAKVFLGAVCTSSAQCPDDSECKKASGTATAKTCVCSVNHFKVGHRCLKRKYGERCTGTADCLDLTCTSNLCTCDSTEKWVGGKCVKKDAKTAGSGEACDHAQTPPGRSSDIWCRANYACTKCPHEAGSKEICRGINGAAPFTVSVAVLLMSFTLSLIF